MSNLAQAWNTYYKQELLDKKVNIPVDKGSQDD